MTPDGTPDGTLSPPPERCRAARRKPGTCRQITSHDSSGMTRGDAFRTTDARHIHNQGSPVEVGRLPRRNAAPVRHLPRTASPPTTEVSWSVIIVPGTHIRNLRSGDPRSRQLAYWLNSSRHVLFTLRKNSSAQEVTARPSARHLRGSFSS